MNERDQTCTPARPIPLPKDAREMVEYIVKNAPGFVGSDAYNIDLDGDHQKHMDEAINVSASFGCYLLSIADCVIVDPERAAELGPEIKKGFDVIEALSTSELDEIINTLTTGTFEAIDSTDSDVTYSTVVCRLGPRSRALWDEWMPKISYRKPDPGLGVKI